jgi:hypothetical protein
MIVTSESIDGVRFGRSRFLGAASAALGAVAAKLWFPERAAAAAPNGCYGYDACSCCNGSRCCRGDCRGGNYGCHSGGQCWYTCAYSGSSLVKFKCCDFGFGGGGAACICRGTVGPC